MQNTFWSQIELCAGGSAEGGPYQVVIGPQIAKFLSWTITRKAVVKILLVNTLANKGGSQLAMLKLARCLRARSHDVHVRFLYGDPSLFEDEMNVHILAPGGPSLRGYARAVLGLVQTFRSMRPAATISFLPLANIMTAIVNQVFGSAFAIASHRSPVETYGSAMRRMDRLVGTCGLYDHIVCVSQAVADGLKDYPASYRRRVSVIHNGVQRPALPPRAEARDKFGLSDGDCAFVAIGRLNFQKNYPALLQWFAQTGGGVLLIAGEGDDRSMLEALITELALAKRVRLLGNLQRSDIEALLAAADIFLQPSRFEGQSNAVLEAMAAGLPVVLSDIPEQREVVTADDGECVGILVPLEDNDGWVSALDRLRVDTSLRQKLGERASEHAREKFSEGRMIDRFEALCDCTSPSVRA